MRTTSSYTSWAPGILGFTKWAGWKQLSIVSSAENLFSLAATELSRVMRVSEIRPSLQQLQAGARIASVLDDVLREQTRVVMVLAAQQDLIPIATAANEKGMVAAGWAWLGLDSVGEAFNQAQRLQATQLPALALAQALNGWIYFVAYTQASASFYKSVLEATRSYDFPRFVDDTVAEPLYAANLYDAILLYANTLHNNLEAQDDSVRLKDQMIAGVAFDGKTGRVALDERGDLIQSISIMNSKLGSDGTMVQHAVGLFDGATKEMTPMTQRVTWPGGESVTPIDSPPIETGFNTIWAVVGCLIGAAVLVAVLIGLLYKYSDRFQAFFHMLVFEVGKQVLTFCSEVSDFVTDAVSFHRAVVADSLKGAYTLSLRFKIAYSCMFAIACISSVVAFGYRGKSAWKLLQAARGHTDTTSASPDDHAASSKGHAMVPKLRWELDKSKRDVIGNAITLFSAFFEDVRPSRPPACVVTVRCADLWQIPMIVLNGILIFDKDVVDKWVRSRCAYGLGLVCCL